MEREVAASPTNEKERERTATSEFSVTLGLPAGAEDGASFAAATTVYEFHVGDTAFLSRPLERPARGATFHDEDKLAALSAWAGIKQLVRRMKDAEDFYRRALAIREEQVGVDHPEVARTLDDLGLCAFAVGRMAEAEEFFGRALAIRAEKLGVDHPDVPSTLNILGNCVCKLGRMKEAEELYRRALEIREEPLGVYHPDVARTVNDLGVCASKEKPGVGHPDVASTLNNLGVCASKVGDMKEAEEFHRRALSIQEEKLGVDHPEVAYTQNHLGVCAHKVARMKDAEECHRRALAIQEEKLGVDHPDVALTLHNLGVCAWKVGRTAKAEELHRRELVRKNSARTTRMKEKAEELFRQALAIRDEKLVVYDWDTAITTKALAELHRSALAVMTQTVAVPVLLAGVVLYVTTSARHRGERPVANGFS
ncbi:unnamed protein product [Ectocarpus sp. CCAP 1310/34]|nr:unnamed protein product [Ectocarpus sp. CCAP 1310/34]